ncbi:DDE Tnp4 domain-containing protein [Mycena kentingensis (nom. inval.)]|nr:DDE Tnp4 domain-containing protein [Mycena kentingensis (nom. inval.)]
MPRKTDRQQETDEVLELIAILTVLEAHDEENEPEDPADIVEDDDDDKPLSELLMLGLISLHAKRYLSERRTIPKGNILDVLLGEWKSDYPDFFRSYLRVTPATFDALISAIEDDPVFHNNSDTAEQLPVPVQLAIALYRFGHYGNGVSVRKVGLQLGVGFGTVVKATRRVIAALCRDRVRQAAIRWPTEAEKEVAKQWVEEHSCPAWRDGWLMVDGTLVPLYARPAHFGNNWYDRKSNYSLNVQLITTPDLRIIDYDTTPEGIYGTAAQRRVDMGRLCISAAVLADGSIQGVCKSYLLCVALMSNRPIKFQDFNELFNYWVSNVRVRSEHAVGYLKGRFSSLRGLRLRIDDHDQIAFATYWVIACMVVHNFAMTHERDINMDTDAFFLEGLQAVQSEREEEGQMDADARDAELEIAEERRTEIKQMLFDYLEAAAENEDTT